MSETPLEQVPSWSADHIARAKESWVTTAEQVVAVAATPAGIKSLSEQLGVSEEKMRSLVEGTRKVLTPEVRAEMETKVDTSDYGLGGPPPEEN